MQEGQKDSDSRLRAWSDFGSQAPLGPDSLPKPLACGLAQVAALRLHRSLIHSRDQGSSLHSGGQIKNHPDGWFLFGRGRRTRTPRLRARSGRGSEAPLEPHSLPRPGFEPPFRWPNKKPPSTGGIYLAGAEGLEPLACGLAQVAALRLHWSLIHSRDQGSSLHSGGQIKNHPQRVVFIWQGQKDSNPQERFWRPLCYHYIMPLNGAFATKRHAPKWCIRYQTTCP